MKKLLAVLVFSVLCVGVANAGKGTNFTDQWYIPSESGWGASISHVEDTMFVTLFVYDSARRPTWYSATLKSAGSTYTGDLYQTSGPWFGTAFNSASVTRQLVGKATFSPKYVERGTLSWTANGATVTKAVERQSLGMPDLGGNYTGGMAGVKSQCTNPANNYSGVWEKKWNLTQSGKAMTMQTDINCTYTGTIEPYGNVAQAAGTFACVDGQKGSWSMWDIRSGSAGMSAQLEFADDNLGCRGTVRMSGVRN